jgi:hypothetical protein
VEMTVRTGKRKIRKLTQGRKGGSGGEVSGRIDLKARKERQLAKTKVDKVRRET